MYHGAAMIFAHSTGSICVKCAAKDFAIPRRDGNENVKNNNRFSWQNNNFAGASHFVVHFVAVFARL